MAEDEDEDEDEAIFILFVFWVSLVAEETPAQILG
jgi:hypothetical protein